MKKLIFKIALLSMLLVFVACANDETSTGGSASLTIPNSTLVAKFFGDMASKDQNPERRANAGNAGIDAGGVTFKFDKQSAEFVNGNAKITFHEDDNTAAEQSAALKARIRFEASAIIQNPSNKIDGLSPLVDVDITHDELSATKATALVTVKTSGESKFEDGEKTKTFNIILTGKYFVPPAIILNETLAIAFNDNDPSDLITASPGNAGIAAGEIVINANNGDFQDTDNTAEVTFDNAEINATQLIAAMKNSVKTAVDDILKQATNTVEGLSTETLVSVRISGTKGLATVTIKVKDSFSYSFEDGSNAKTFVITLTSDRIKKTIITNTKLAEIFNGAPDDRSRAVNLIGGLAGIKAEGIILNAVAGKFDTSNTNVIFHIGDTTAANQNAAILYSVKLVVNEILGKSVNKIDGLNTNAVFKVVIADSTTATATATINTIDGYEFEGGSTSKDIVVKLTGTFTNHTVIPNSDLQSEFDGNDESPNHNEEPGKASIRSKEITLKVINGKFQDDNNVAVTFHGNDDTIAEQAIAIEYTVKKIVDFMLVPSRNKVKGLDGKSTVKFIEKTGETTATARVTIKSIGGYKFEDGTTSKTFTITLNSMGFEGATLYVNANAPSQTRAGLTGFIIPKDFSDITDKVAVTFHNLDNVFDDEKKIAIKNAMLQMNLPKGNSLKVKSVGDFQSNDNTIEVTFNNNKVVKIYLSGYFGDQNQEITIDAFKTDAFGATGGYAGLPRISVGKDFTAPKITHVAGYSGRPNDDGKKAQIIGALNAAFLQRNQVNYGDDYPEGIQYYPGNVVVKSWSEINGVFTVTFGIATFNGPFVYPGGKGTQKMDIKIGK